MTKRFTFGKNKKKEYTRTLADVKREQKEICASMPSRIDITNPRAMAEENAKEERLHQLIEEERVMKNE